MIVYRDADVTCVLKIQDHFMYLSFFAKSGLHKKFTKVRSFSHILHFTRFNRPIICIKKELVIKVCNKKNYRENLLDSLKWAINLLQHNYLRQLICENESLTWNGEWLIGYAISTDYPFSTGHILKFRNARFIRSKYPFLGTCELESWFYL